MGSLGCVIGTVFLLATPVCLVKDLVCYPIQAGGTLIVSDDDMRKGYRMRKDLQKAFPFPYKVGRINDSFYYWWKTHAEEKLHSIIS